MLLPLGVELQVAAEGAGTTEGGWALEEVRGQQGREREEEDLN